MSDWSYCDNTTVEAPKAPESNIDFHMNDNYTPSTTPVSTPRLLNSCPSSPELIQLKQNKTERSGVIIVTKTTPHQMLMVWQGDKPYYRSFPKGQVEFGETLQDTAIRELYEETLLILSEGSLDAAQLIKLPKFNHTYFIVWQDNKFPVSIPTSSSCLPEEIIGNGWFTYESIMERHPLCGMQNTPPECTVCNNGDPKLLQKCKINPMGRFTYDAIEELFDRYIPR